MGSGWGVVNNLIDAMEEQEAKEAVLGYYALLQQDAIPKSLEDIANIAEEFLHTAFGLENTNFEADDAVKKLVKDGIAVELDGQQRYVAIPPEEAFTKQKNKWKNYAADFASAPLNTNALSIPGSMPRHRRETMLMAVVQH